MRIQPKRIICTTDFSDLSQMAVSYGIALAQEFKATLYLCHVIDLAFAFMYGEAFLDLEALKTQVRMNTEDEFRKVMEGRNVDWELLMPVGKPADEVLREAKENTVDLVVAATHGRSGLKRFILGSVAEGLMRTLPCPLLAVRGLGKDMETRHGGEFSLGRILVGSDFSADSNLALQYALSFAQEFQSELHLVHVIEPPVYQDLFEEAVSTGEKLREDLRDQLNRKMTDSLPPEIFTWCDPKTILLAGHPHEEITKYAVIHNMDLIVLGVRGHGLMETLLVGSTTDRVVRQAPCPVLTVRPLVQLDE
jgi:nucleotide-binding universal stress UspA family protein